MGPGQWPKDKPKSFDAIAWKREVQARFHADTEGMTTEELIAFLRQRVAESEFAKFFPPNAAPSGNDA